MSLLSLKVEDPALVLDTDPRMHNYVRKKDFFYHTSPERSKTLKHTFTHVSICVYSITITYTHIYIYITIFNIYMYVCT